MAKVQGKNIKLCYKNAQNQYVPFGFARTASISMQTEMKEVSSPSTGTSKAYIPGRSSWSMSCGCLYGNHADAINAFNSRTSLQVQWQDTTNSKTFSGTAYISSLKATGNIHEMATFDIELQGTGALTYS